MTDESLLGLTRSPISETDEEEGSINLEKLTKAELIDYAYSQGIDLNMRMTKSDMIAEIEAE